MKLYFSLLVILWLCLGLAMDSYLVASHVNESGTEISESGEPAKVAVSKAAAPPAWAQDLIVLLEKIPVVGPFIAKTVLYLGIVSATLTTIVGTLLTILNSIMALLTFFERPDVASIVARFRDGKIMYWLRFFSIFNAKKPARNEMVLN